MSGRNEMLKRVGRDTPDPLPSPSPHMFVCMNLQPHPRRPRTATSPTVMLNESKLIHGDCNYQRCFHVQCFNYPVCMVRTNYSTFNESGLLCMWSCWTHLRFLAASLTASSDVDKSGGYQKHSRPHAYRYERILADR